MLAAVDTFILVNNFTLLDEVAAGMALVQLQGPDGLCHLAHLDALVFELGAPLAIPVKGRVSNPEVAALLAFLVVALFVAAVLGFLGVEFVSDNRLFVAFAGILAALGVSKVFLSRLVAEGLVDAIAVNVGDGSAALLAVVANGALGSTVALEA